MKRHYYLSQMKKTVVLMRIYLFQSLLFSDNVMVTNFKIIASNISIKQMGASVEYRIIYFLKILKDYDLKYYLD